MDKVPVTLDGTALQEPGAATQIVERFKKDLDGSDGEVVLDLRSLSKIQSLGITLLIGLQKECTKRQRKLSIHLADNEVHFLLKMFKLDRLLTLRIEGPAA